ncbi:MAG: ribosome maturation factor RimP [Fusobacteriaceae bacterium]|nr:ribosome maturation factor RimP [Fusobacteriaceae bacterium]MBP6322271.1 ribosome maturation factor RimP [Fusobacteriaceae bacterium]MBP9509567.1 ribosome maturation factor RimP [Fusobacteriaceae bacterium]
MEKDYSYVISKVEEIVLPHLKNMGLELVDVEFMQDGGYWYLRVFIENLNGEVTVENCAELSHKIDVDVDNLIEQKFFLEVSSPGVERPLKKIEDFIRFVGDDIFVALKHKIGNNKNYTGTLLEVKNNDTILLALDTDETMSIPYKEIKKANIVYIFEDLD